MAKSKACTKCQELKPLSEFSNDKYKYDGVSPSCKACRSLNRLNYVRTKKGLISSIYKTQKESSKDRGHIMPQYDLNWLSEWVENQVNFLSIYNNWVASGFDTSKRPSIDRINDNKPYSIDNIRLVTWHENHMKWHNDCKEGKNLILSKPVAQLSMSGDLIEKYESAKSAARKTGIDDSSISKCCRFIRKSAGGSNWIYDLSYGGLSFG